MQIWREKVLFLTVAGGSRLEGMTEEGALKDRVQVPAQWAAEAASKKAAKVEAAACTIK